MNAPETIKAGFAYEWEETHPDYSPEDYSLSVTFVLLTSAATTKTVTGTSNGSGFTVTLTSTVSATFTAGTYKVYTYAVDGAEKYLISEKDCTVFANPLQTTGDHRSHVQKVLDAINAVLEGRADQQYATLSIDGTSITALSHDQLLNFKMKYENLLYKEQEKARIAAGGKARRKIIPRFQ